MLVSDTLFGLHAYPGRDTVSAFSGKAKVKPLKQMMKNEKYISTFACIGEVEISTSSLDALVEFFCELYGQRRMQGAATAANAAPRNG